MIPRILGILALVALATCINRGSLTFVIDDTLSMGPTIQEVKKASLKIMDIVFSKPTTPIEDIVLVTFNDPTFELRVKTRDKIELESALNKIRVHNYNNRYCPEYPLSGLELALLEGHNNSFVFLFTDAAAEDGYKLNSVINIAQEKQTQVNFIITPSPCNVEIHDGYLYYKIAAQTNGQIFHLKSTAEIQDLFKYVDTVIAGERTVIVNTVIPANKHVDVPFTVDDQTEYVVVSASGKDVDLTVTGPVKDYEKLTWLKNTKMVKLNHPEPGDYIAKVFGVSSTSVMVFGRTDFTFEHGFSTAPANSLRNTDKQPIDGSTYHLLISVTDPSHSVQINNVILRTMDGRDLKTLALKKVSEDLYTTDQFEIPSQTDMLDIVVVGVGIKTNRLIRRRSKTPVVIRKQDIKPRVTLDKTMVPVDYNDEVVLVCNVKAHPKPTIKWFLEPDTTISTSERADPPYDYTSSVRLTKVKKSHHVMCTAENLFGTTSQESTVVVKSPFVVHDEPSERTKYINYGKAATIDCNIKSRFNMQISWFKETSLTKLEPINISPKFLISNDGTELTIHNVDEITEAKYVCEAFIIGDESTNHVLSRNVHIVKVAPALSVDKDFIVVSENIPEIRIKCNILTGYPRPIITWMFRSDSGELRYMPGESSNVLNINDINLEKAGNYTCIAKNEVGIVSQSVNVVVQVKPSLEKGTDAKVKENATVTLSCRIIKSNPKALITWEFKRASLEDFVKQAEIGELFTIQKAGLHHAGYYKCVADNGVGRDERVIELIVEAPPKIYEDNPLKTAVESDAALRLPCTVTGYPKPSIVWNINGTEIKPDGKKYIIIDGTLVIKDPLKSDNNNYTCEATNEFGTDSATFETHITRDIEHEEDHGDEKRIYILKGDSKRLKCGKDTPEKVVWFKENILFNESRTLTIKNAKFYDDGNYTCRASSLSSVTAHTYIVDVGYAPVFLDKIETEVDWDGDYQLLRCEVRMKPEIETAKVEWTYNGEVLNTTLQVQNIVGWGHYTCKISNLHGIVERKFSVYSSGCLIRRDAANKKMPVIFSKDSMWPKLDTVRKYFVLETDDELKLSCNSQAGRPNSFEKFPGKHEIVAFCNREDKFTVGVGDENYKFDDLICEYPVLPSFQPTGDKCLQENTELIKVGFGNEIFVEAYEICYDRSNENALYTRIDISTPINLAGVADATWNNYTLASDDAFYNCTGDATCCYSRAQLVNAQDVKFGPPQTATYYIRLNSVPLWRTCDPKQVTWDEVEVAVREILSEFGAIRVWTGASQYTVRGSEKSPNVQDKPRYLWKVVKSEELTFSIVYVNDPFPTSSDVRCSGTCPADVPSSTYTYCCNLFDFSKAFDVPESVFDFNLDYSD